MSKKLQDKVALITGSGRGIGRALAMKLAAEGASIVVNDLDSGPAEEVVAAIRAAGGQAVACPGSVTAPDFAERFVGTAVSAFKRIDIIVNNAGILRDVMFHRMSEADFDAVIAVHLKGSFNVSRAAAPHFKEQSDGVFVHMTSTSALVGNFGQANYSAAKLGIVGLSKSIALDMARFNVRSNCIAPFAWSRMIGSIPTDTPEQQARVEKLKKLGTAQIAPVAAFLASDAAGFMTGASLIVDGGITVGPRHSWDPEAPGLADALQAMADRWDLEDMRMFVVSLSVQSETGGNLAEILENLSTVIRARAAMYMKVRALSSEGRLTGWMLTVLPIISLLGMVTVNPAFYLEVAADPIFIWGFASLILLYFLGVFIIRHMVDLKV